MTHFFGPKCWVHSDVILQLIRVILQTWCLLLMFTHFLPEVNYLVNDDHRGRKNERQEVFPANTAMRSRLLIKKSNKSRVAQCSC